jgi:hypothetical protein
VPQDNPSLEVLDARQLSRIEATHRGYLYQHLFAAGCLLKGDPGVQSVVVEHDEDLELLTGQRHIYAQIKTRAGTLLAGELDGFFARARDLSAAHANGARPGSAEFWLVTNAEVSGGLASRLAAENIALWSPHTVSRDEPLFPPPHADVPASFAWCAKAASQIALTRLSPETLVWKLAAVVAYRSAGIEGGHMIVTSELAALFELFAAQLHHFPESPAIYRAQENEPQLEGEDRALLVVSVSGAGKTAWASHSALHSGAAIVYFDAAGVPDAAVASSLLREAVAQLTTRSEMDAKDVIQPGASGMEGLRGVDFLAKRARVRPIVVMDNVQTVTAGTIRKIATALASCRLVLLGQPAPVAAELEELLGITAVTLSGWSLVTIAAEFASAHALVDPATAERVRELTGGVPRFVNNAAALTEKFYSGDAEAFCSAVESSANTTRTAQELILRESFNRLSANAQLAIALMSLARFPLSESECLDFLSAHERFRSPAAAAGAIRELRDWGVAQRLMSGALVTHDAFVVMSAALFETLGADVKMAAKQKLAAVVEKSVAPGQVARLTVYCRLLPQIGRVEALADIASSLSEHIHEQGRSADLEMVLEDVLVSSEVAPLDKFMVADTLALWEFHQPDKSGFVKLVRVMEQLAKEHDLGGDTPSRLAMKQMLVVSLNGETAGIRLYSARAFALADSPMLRRIALYNTATAWYMADKPEETLDITEQLISEYYDVLHLTDKQVVAVSAKALSDALGSDFDTMDELKRLADTLDLRARALNDIGLQSGLCRLHAMKFYQIAHVPMSLMKVGQDVVDELLGMLGDPWEARRVIETLLLPIVQEYRLVEYVVSVRAQFAVVLAYCGEIEPARRLIRELKAFAVSDFRRKELENQTRLIEKIALEQPFIARPTIEANVPKVGRNERCPCGSGKKYKKCHGA